MVKAIFPSEVERLWKLGFAIHWLRPKSKIPVEGGWTSGERKTVEELNATFKRGYNYGVRLGSPSRVAGAYLAVVDVDVKSELPSDRREAIDKAVQLFPQLKDGPHLLSGRGNGSRHYYVRLPEAVRGGGAIVRSEKVVKLKMPSAAPNKREAEELTDAEVAAGIRLRPAWEISLLCDGQQSAVVGSIHPDTGTAYAWGKAVNGSGKDIPLIEGVLPGNQNAAEVRASRKGPEKKPTFDFVTVDPEKLPLSKDKIAAIVDGRGADNQSDKIFGLCIELTAAGVSDIEIVSLFTQRELFLGKTAFVHRKTTDRQHAARWINDYCLRKAKTRVNQLAFDDVEEVPEAQTDAEMKAKKKEANAKRPRQMRERVWPPGFNGDDWEEGLQLKFNHATKESMLDLTLANVCLVLTHRAPRPDFVRFEEFSGRVKWNADCAWGTKAGKERSAGTEDAIAIRMWFAETYKVEPHNSLIDDALMYLAQRNRYHVVKEYLEPLEWDGVERVAVAFKTYLGARMPEPYLSEASRKFFMACIHRIYRPGCKFDHVVVLEGKQGRGKSTFGRRLASDDWFLDSLPNLHDKDAALNLNGIWICEFGELAAVNRSSNDSTKCFITRSTDKVRPPFGARRIDYPRSTVFLGTTDKNDYLTDAAGNRRFWPVKVRQCDFEALERDRDQLWAEAYWRYLFCEKEDLYFKADELAGIQAVEIQSTRRVEDEGDLMFNKFSAWLVGEKAEKRDASVLSLTDLFDGTPFGTIQATRGNIMRAGDVLRKFGYEKKHTNRGSIWRRKTAVNT